jgi:hypothetical protein
MADNEPLSRWEVYSMIDERIERYDLRQERRHKENSEKLDRNANAVVSLSERIAAEFKEVRTTLAAEKAALTGAQLVKDYKQYIFPVLLTLGLVIIGVLDLLKK